MTQCKNCITINSRNAKHHVRQLHEIDGCKVCIHCDRADQWPSVRKLRKSLGQ